MTVVVVHAAAWWVITGRLLAGLPALTEQAGAAGWRIEWGPAQRSGWPLAAAVRLPEVRAVRALGSAELRWTADGVVLAVAAADPGALRVSVEGGQTVSFGDAAAVPFRAEREVARAPFSGAPVTFEVRALGIGGTVRGVSVADISGSLAELAIAFTATGVQVSPALPAPFDRGGVVSAHVLMDPAFPDAATGEASAAAWRAAGGHVDAASLALDWGSLHVTGHGGGGLDERLQPAGQAELLVQGAPEMLTAAAQGGLVPAGPASAARAVLQLLTLSARGGPVPLPVALAGQRLTVAGFPLVLMPTLQWGVP